MAYTQLLNGNNEILQVLGQINFDNDKIYHKFIELLEKKLDINYHTGREITIDYSQSNKNDQKAQ